MGVRYWPELPEAILTEQTTFAADVGGGGGGGPITAEDEIPDKEETEERPMRWAMALLDPSFFNSCAACRLISWA